MWPTGTVTQEDGMMLTPMHNDGSYFTVMLQVPYQATIDYGFIVTRSYDGTVIGEIWEGDFESINAVESGVTEIYSLLTLPLDPLAAFVADLRFRGGAVLKLTAGFLLALGLVAGIAARPKRSLFRRLPQINRNLLELVLVIIGFKIVLIIVVYLVLVVFNPTNPLYIKFQPGYMEQLIGIFSKGDVGWYMNIANDGYEARPFSATQLANWAFYPLWPLLLHISHYLPLDMMVWGIWLANALSIVAIVGVYLLVLLDFDQQAAILTALFTVAFPGAYFFIRPGPEALFLLLVVFSLYAARKQYWLIAGVLGALATLARLNGFLLFLVLLFMYYRQYKATRHHRVTVISLFLIPTVLLLHMAYLYNLTGNFFASLDIQSAWNNLLSYPFSAMVHFISTPVLVDYGSWNLVPVSFVFVFGSVVLTIVAIVMWHQKRFPADWLLYMILSLILVVSRNNLNGLLRYLVVVFPLFLTLALLVRQRRMNCLAALFSIYRCAGLVCSCVCIRNQLGGYVITVLRLFSPCFSSHFDFISRGFCKLINNVINSKKSKEFPLMRRPNYTLFVAFTNYLQWVNMPVIIISIGPVLCEDTDV